MMPHAAYRRERGPYVIPKDMIALFTNLDITLSSAICIRYFKLTLALYCIQLRILDLVMYLNCTLRVHLEDHRMYVARIKRPLGPPLIALGANSER